MGQIESLGTQPRGRWKGSPSAGQRNDWIGSEHFAVEIRDPYRGGIEDAHAVIFALPRSAPGRQYGEEFRKSFCNDRCDLIFVVIPAEESLCYCFWSKQSDGNLLGLRLVLYLPDDTL